MERGMFTQVKFSPISLTTFWKNKIQLENKEKMYVWR